jgi:hypothetical protein
LLKSGVGELPFRAWLIDWPFVVMTPDRIDEAAKPAADGGLLPPATVNGVAPDVGP